MFDDLIRKYLESDSNRKFTIKDKIFFFKELAYLVEGWIVITDSITLIKENTDSASIKKICEDVYSSLKKWEPFSRAISKLNKYFNEWDANIIKSWETSWELVKVLKYLASEYEFLYDIRNRYVWAMIYPSLVFSVSIIALYIVFTMILPWILELVADFETASIPASTQLLINITDFLIENNVLILIGIFLSLLAFSIFLGIQEWKKWFDKQVFKFPFFWKLTKYYYLIKFLRYKKLLLASWMNYVDIFKSLKKLFNNTQYTDLIDEILVNIKKWENILDPVKSYKNIIPADVFVLLKSWQESANMDSAIENAIWLYQEDFDKQLDWLSKVIEPILVIFVWWIVAFIALSVFWIVWSLLDVAV